MKFSTFLFPDSRDPAQDGQVIDETLREALLADELGADIVWLAEHHFDGISVYADPIPLAGALAVAMKRAGLGFAVIQTAFTVNGTLLNTGIAQQLRQVAQQDFARVRQQYGHVVNRRETGSLKSVEISFLDPKGAHPESRINCFVKWDAGRGTVSDDHQKFTDPDFASGCHGAMHSDLVAFRRKRQVVADFDFGNNHAILAGKFFPHLFHTVLQFALRRDHRGSQLFSQAQLDFVGPQSILNRIAG